LKNEIWKTDEADLRDGTQIIYSLFFNVIDTSLNYLLDEDQ
jgi:hypothetical protein